MTVSLSSSYVADGQSSDVHLLDPSCTGQVYNNEIILVTDFDRCGTTVDVSNDLLLFLKHTKSYG